jgi:hypothetical protein
MEQRIEPAPHVPVEVTRTVTLRYTAAPLQGAKVKDKSPLAGRITQLVPHFPPGTNGLVDMAFGHSAIWVMPTTVDTYLALDSATPVLVVDEPIAKSEEIWMIVRNGDAANPHTVSITVVMTGVE